MDPQDRFRTTDVDLAALLSSSNIHYVALDVSAGSFCEFVYEPSDALWSVVASWGRGDPCLVDARLFGRTRRQLMRTAQRLRGGRQ